MDRELKRCCDLIPNLVETVKSYAAHERVLLRTGVEAQARAMATVSLPAQHAPHENALVQALRQLAVAEGYPQLKADQHFLERQTELAKTEDRLQAAGRFYSAHAREFNTRLEVFPSNLMTRVFGFPPAPFFAGEEAVRAAPAVSFTPKA